MDASVHKWQQHFLKSFFSNSYSGNFFLMFMDIRGLIVKEYSEDKISRFQMSKKNNFPKGPPVCHKLTCLFSHNIHPMSTAIYFFFFISEHRWQHLRITLNNYFSNLFSEMIFFIFRVIRGSSPKVYLQHRFPKIHIREICLKMWVFLNLQGLENISNKPLTK